jgi:ribosomal protein L37E
MSVRDVLQPLFGETAPTRHVECRECGGNLTIDAEECPHCGGGVAVYDVA